MCVCVCVRVCVRVCVCVCQENHLPEIIRSQCGFGRHIWDIFGTYLGDVFCLEDDDFLSVMIKTCNKYRTNLFSSVVEETKKGLEKKVISKIVTFRY